MNKPSSHQRLKQKLARLNPRTDCVAILQPNQGIAFHIPDEFVEQVKVLKAGERMPVYVEATLLYVHILRYLESDPTVREFVDKARDQMYLDLAKSGGDEEIH